MPMGNGKSAMLRARKSLPPLIVLALGVVTAGVQGQSSSVDHARSASGVIAQHFDPAVRPQDDLFSHVNGTWLKTGEIPPEQVSQGALIELTESVDHAIRALIED